MRRLWRSGLFLSLILLVVLWLVSYFAALTVSYGTYASIPNRGSHSFTVGIGVEGGVLHVGDVRGAWGGFLTARISRFPLISEGWSCSVQHRFSDFLAGFFKFQIRIDPER